MTAGPKGSHMRSRPNTPRLRSSGPKACQLLMTSSTRNRPAGAAEKLHTGGAADVTSFIARANGYPHHGARRTVRPRRGSECPDAAGCFARHAFDRAFTIVRIAGEPKLCTGTHRARAPVSAEWMRAN